MRPYIGVSGITANDQAVRLLKNFYEPVSHQLMIGVLASEFTLGGKENKNPRRYPQVGKIAGIFPDHTRALNMIRYETEHPETLASQLFELNKHGGHSCHGFQISAIWPKPGQIWPFREMYPRVKLMLCVGPMAMKACRNDPVRIADRLREYQNAVDGIVLDFSGDTRILLDPVKALESLDCFKQKTSSFEFGIAGNLNFRNLGRLDPLVKKYPRLSIETEDSIRDPMTDMFLEKEAKVYLRSAKHLYRRRK